MHSSGPLCVCGCMRTSVSICSRDKVSSVYGPSLKRIVHVLFCSLLSSASEFHLLASEISSSNTQTIILNFQVTQKCPSQLVYPKQYPIQGHTLHLIVVSLKTFFFILLSSLFMTLVEWSRPACLPRWPTLWIYLITLRCYLVCRFIRCISYHQEVVSNWIRSGWRIS